jgi:ribonuclease P protein component
MLSRSHRFHGPTSLRYAFRQGKVVRGQQLNLRYALNTRRQGFRAAVVVSRKVDKRAVVRNRLRRRVYEIIRLEADRITQPYDLVLTVYDASLATAPPAQLQHLVQGQLVKAGIIQK